MVTTVAPTIPVLAAIIIWPLTKVSEFSFLLAKDKVGMAAERLRIDNAVYRGETERGGDRPKHDAGPTPRRDDQDETREDHHGAFAGSELGVGGHFKLGGRLARGPGDGKRQ